MPEALLHTGDRWDYPRWYIKYLRGEGDRKLPSAVNKLLSHLRDGAWRFQIYKSGAGIGTVEASVELEIIQMDKVVKPYRSFVAESDHGIITDIEDVQGFAELFKGLGNSFFAVYRITERGKTVLAENKLP